MKIYFKQQEEIFETHDIFYSLEDFKEILKHKYNADLKHNFKHVFSRFDYVNLKQVQNDFIKVDSSLESYLTLRGISYLNKLLSNLNKVNIGNIETYQLLKKIINEYYNNNGNKKNKPL